MPLYSYRCVQCQRALEILVHDLNFEPKLCGHRCVLESHIDPQERGMGELQRILQANQGVIRSSALREKPSIEELGKAGFTILKNEGDGNVRKIAGPSIHKNKYILQKNNFHTKK